MGDFLAGIFGGSNPSLPGIISQSGQEGTYGLNTGQGATTQASNYFSNILGGNPQAIAQALAPEISANQQEAQQKKDTTAQFGGRSGGNTASTNAIDSQSRGNIINLIGGEQNNAASNLASLGTSEQGLGLQGLGLQENASQQNLQNQQNSLFGNILGGLAGNLGTGLSGMGAGLIGF